LNHKPLGGNLKEKEVGLGGGGGRDYKRKKKESGETTHQRRELLKAESVLGKGGEKT